MFKSLLSCITIAGFTLLMSCSKSDPVPVTLTANTVANLAADPPSGGYNPINGQPIGVTKKYTLFSFKSGMAVANVDSASSKWDIGFNGTNIIVNSGTSGPGTASAQVVNGIFTDITLAPDDGYKQDNKVTPFYAITRGSGNGWYNYNQASNLISPIAGRILVIKTADQKYAKMEILSYYQNSPVSPSSTDKDRYYTFRYVYQSDGSKNLK